MIALFARANHPVGYGYASREQPGQGGAHGYVVVGIDCASFKQRDRVLNLVGQYGIDLPDLDRGHPEYEREPRVQRHYFNTIHPEGKPSKPYQDKVDLYKYNGRWYSGGGGDWDYLFTIPGHKLDEPGWDPSRGDNRFVCIYEAKYYLDSLK